MFPPQISGRRIAVTSRPIVRVAAPGFPFARLPTDSVVVSESPSFSLAPGETAAVTMLLKGKVELLDEAVADLGRTHMTAEWHLQFACTDEETGAAGWSDFTEATLVRAASRCARARSSSRAAWDVPGRAACAQVRANDSFNRINKDKGLEAVALHGLSASKLLRRRAAWAARRFLVPEHSVEQANAAARGSSNRKKRTSHASDPYEGAEAMEVEAEDGESRVWACGGIARWRPLRALRPRAPPRPASAQ